MSQDSVDAYRHALAGALVADLGAAGRVRVTGRDRLDFLHRMSTQDLKDLPVGRLATTVLTTPIARIVDRLDILNLGEHLIVLTGAGRATAVRKWLSGYIFFRDEVKLQDAGGELGQLALVGPKAVDVLAAVLPGFDAAQPEGAVATHADVSVARQRRFGLDCLMILPPVAETAGWLERLQAQGAVRGEAAVLEQLRIRAGEPGAGHEVTDAYLPLEVDLWGAVSFSKGCYIGQEILARMESRGKLARRLRGLRAAAPLTEGAEVRAGLAGAGAALVGVVSSAAELVDLGPVGLAVLRTGVEPGQVVDAGGVVATVVELPFTL